MKASIKGSGKPSGWVKGAHIRASADHQYHAGKHIHPNGQCKSAKASTSGKAKNT